MLQKFQTCGCYFRFVVVQRCYRGRNPDFWGDVSQVLEAQKSYLRVAVLKLRERQSCEGGVFARLQRRQTRFPDIEVGVKQPLQENRLQVIKQFCLR